MALSACKPKALYICTVYSQWSKPLPHEEAPAGPLMSPRFFSAVSVSHRFPSLGCGRKCGQSRVLSFASGLHPGVLRRYPAWREAAASPRVEPLVPGSRVCSASPVPVPGGRDPAPCGASISAAKDKGSGWSLAAGTPRPRPGLLLGAAGGPRSSGVGALCAVRERPPTQPRPWGTGEGGPRGQSRSSAGGDRAARGWRERAPPPARAAPSVPQVRPPRLL